MYAIYHVSNAIQQHCTYTIFTYVLRYVYYNDVYFKGRSDFYKVNRLLYYRLIDIISNQAALIMICQRRILYPIFNQTISMHVFTKEYRYFWPIKIFAVIYKILHSIS